MRAVHRAYLDAGADLIETNTFNATRISQADYGARARRPTSSTARAPGSRALECDAKTAQTPDQPRFVVGVLGPTNRTASISPDVNNPGFRNVTFDELVAAYREATRGLIDGGADVIMVETIFDMLNAKAALFAIDEVFEERGARLPIMISGTITDLSGRTLSGQTADAFWYSVRHARPLAIGLNCALGATELRAVRRHARAGRRLATSARTRTRACRTRSATTTRRPSRWPRRSREFARAGLAQHRRRLLRHDAGAHRGDRRSRARRLAAARRADAALPRSRMT